MIRGFTPTDIASIEQVGKTIDFNYKFKINPYIHCLVYEQESIVGFIIFQIMYEKAEIIDIAVKEEYQRQMIGSQLLENATLECMANKCENITLEVREGNLKAISFYQKHGFKVATIRKGYYQDGENALLMIKTVV